jgi:polar amino acid transport system substrate-binding protein
MKADGSLNELIVKWFGEGVPTYNADGSVVSN